MHYLYIIQSKKDNKYYIGVTNNLQKRVKEHNLGLSKSTANRKPFVLVHYEKFNNIADAYQREAFLKSKKSSKILRKVIENT